MSAEIAPDALAHLRRRAVEYRVGIVGSFMESTPEGLWHADQRHLDDALLRKVDRIQWELRRDFERMLSWQMFYGEGSVPPPREREMVDGLTPEQFFNRELAR